MQSKNLQLFSHKHVLLKKLQSQQLTLVGTLWILIRLCVLACHPKKVQTPVITCACLPNHQFNKSLPLCFTHVARKINSVPNVF